MKRSVDELGRIVLPAEYRNALNIQEKDAVEVSLEADTITIQKTARGCCFCHSEVNLVRIGEEVICKSCMHELCEAIDDGTITPENPAPDSRR